MIAICLLTTISLSTLVRCDVKGSNTVQESKIKKATYKEFTYDVNPETFTLIVEHDGVKGTGITAFAENEGGECKKR